MADTKALVEQAVRRFQEQVPALAQLKLVLELELRARGDVQLLRVELPGPVVSKEDRGDARLRLQVNRADFNQLAVDGTIASWRKAFDQGHATVSGPVELQRLILQVVEKQEQRQGLRRARQRP